MKGIVFLTVLLLAATATALLVGQVPLGPGALWQGLVGGDGPAALTLRVLRAPRVAVALGTGAALGLSGAVFQILFRNPLASPDLMGFTAGSGLAILLGVTLGWSLPYPLLAALGGLGAALVVAAAVSGNADGSLEGTPALRLVLVGIGIGFTAAALGTFLMTRLSGPQASEAHRWLTGSLTARTWLHGAQVWLVGGVLTLLLVPQVRALRLLQLGPDLAQGLGTRVSRSRWALAATGVGLAAIAVAVAGPVAFVALMAPPLGTRLVGAASPEARLASAAGAGALVVVLADLVSRAAVPGFALPIGALTGLLGAPYLLWRLWREMERGEL